MFKNEEIRFWGVPNQYVIKTDNGERIFKSYNSIIVLIDKQGNIFLDENDWDYSSTTGKYRNLFLGENTNEIRKKIKSGD